MFPTREEFLEECKKDNDDAKWELFQDWSSHNFRLDYKLDTGDDEGDFISSKTNEELYSLMLNCALECWEDCIRNGLTQEQIMELATEKEKKEYEQIKELQILEAI